MTDPITCVVADDHPAMLAAVAEILGRSGFEVVGRARDGSEALALIESEKPALAIVDVQMPQLSGIEVAIRIATTAPGTAIVFYTAFGDRALLSEALDVGARGFVLKEAPLADLVRAAERVAAGEAYVDPVLAGTLAAPILPDAEGDFLHDGFAEAVLKTVEDFLAAIADDFVQPRAADRAARLVASFVLAVPR